MSKLFCFKESVKILQLGQIMQLGQILYSILLRIQQALLGQQILRAGPVVLTPADLHHRPSLRIADL